MPTSQFPGSDRLRGKHLIRNRRVEVLLGLLAVLIATLLLWDAFDNRGVKMWWPFSGLAWW